MANPKLTGIKACVSDAYGTLFDVNSTAAQAKDELGDHFKLKPREMCFLSSNAWDAHAAKANGYRVLWCNRFGQAPERIPEAPDGEITTLEALPEIAGLQANSREGGGRLAGGHRRN